MASLREVEYAVRSSKLVSGATAAVNARAAQGPGRPPVHFFYTNSVCSLM